MRKGDSYIPKYSIIVTYGNGTRGYVVAADGKAKALEKLFAMIGDQVSWVVSISIAEILLDSDMILK